MPKMLRDRFWSICLVLVLSPGAAAFAESQAERYREVRAELVAAYQAEDFAAMEDAAQRALTIRPGFAGALFNLAFAQALNDDPDAALQTLQWLLRQRVDFGVADIEAFAALKELPEWPAYSDKVARLYEPRGNAQIASRYDSADFVPEGIALAPDGDVLIGSIRRGDIVRLDSDSQSARTLVAGVDAEHWSVYGMRLVDDTLWFVSSEISQFRRGDIAPEDSRTGLFAIDVNSGEYLHKAILPANENQQVLGDLLFVGEDTVLLADQTDGVIYSYSLAERTFSEIVAKGQLGSPQGMAFDAAGNGVYIADYIGGLFRLNLSDGNLEKVAISTDVNDYGIDGLYRYGDSLIAIQNGIRPHRVTQMQLSADGGAVIDSKILAMNLPEFDEPNLGQVVDDAFYFVANSHWNRFDAEGNLPDDLTGPIVLRIGLGGFDRSGPD